ncbi:MAG: glycosyltransferase family 39 protein [Candidatus Eiseniibacteriota bacterium]
MNQRPPDSANHKTPRVAIGVLVALVAAKLLLHLAAIGQYGYFRDELYYLASTEHLDWGYVDHPPFSIAVLAVVRALLGDSLPALRIVPALAGVATVVFTGLIARELGGRGFALGLAALAAVLSPVFLGTGRYYSMNAFELLFWPLATWLVLRALAADRKREWILLGIVCGLGLLNKISMIWFLGGLGAGLLLTPYRRVLRGPWPWVAIGLAGLFFLPHVVWQIGHGWPTLEFMRNAASHKMVRPTVIGFLGDQILYMNVGAVPVWIAGILYGAFSRDSGKGRILVGLYLAVLALLLVAGSARASYLAPAYCGLLALGGIAIERWTRTHARVVLRAMAVVLVVAGGVLSAPLALPLLPAETYVRYQAALGLAPRTEERHEMGALPQHFADMFGWEEMTALVAEAYRRLTPEEQVRCRIFGQNYGEAGAIDVLGRRLGLPHALSGHNSYWLWGPGEGECDVLIIIGGDREDNAELFEDIEIVGQTQSRWSMPYERGLDVSIARKPRVDLRGAWPRLKHYN